MGEGEGSDAEGAVAVSKNPYGRVKWRKTGCVLNERTADMLLWVEERSGLTMHVGQGSYKGNGGGAKVGASGATHDGGGAVDLSIRWFSKHDRKIIVETCKDAGFAAWHRPQNWDRRGGTEHAHLVAIGDRELSSSAAWQVSEYLAGRTGLTSALDDPSYRPDPQVKWFESVNAPRPIKTQMLWDGVIPPQENIEKAEREGISNSAVWRLACRLHDLGFYDGTPVRYEQRFPVKAFIQWQRQRGYRETGTYGPVAHRIIF